MIERRTSVAILCTIIAVVAVAAAVFVAHAGSDTSGEALSDVSFIKNVSHLLGADNKAEYILTTNSTLHRVVKVMFPGETVRGPTLRPEAKVHVVVAHGHFVDDAASPPTTSMDKDPVAPHGTWLTLVVARATGDVMAVEVANREPPIRRLGNVVRTQVSG